MSSKNNIRIYCNIFLRKKTSVWTQKKQKKHKKALIRVFCPSTREKSCRFFAEKSGKCVCLVAFFLKFCYNVCRGEMTREYKKRTNGRKGMKDTRLKKYLSGLSVGQAATFCARLKGLFPYQIR
jgi:hypothetical protein